MLAAVLFLLPSAQANEDIVELGHTAAWYNPDRSGEGLLLEILPQDRALVYWFTYDEEGNQRWLTGVGNVLQDDDGEYIHFPELLVTHGGIFGPEFDKDAVVREVVGEAVLRFTDCQVGDWSWDVFEQTGASAMQRLSQTMGAGCQSINGEPGFPIEEYAGQSGSWYDPSHSGEGFVLEWLSRGEALVYWFSYDTRGQQYWMFGVGSLVDGEIVVPQLYATRGAKFGDAFNEDDVEVFPWGSLSLAIDCSSGVASYAATVADFGEGEQQVIRLTRVAQPACPWTKPKLTDLYEFTWTEIPIEPGTLLEPNNVQAESIADDGTVVAKRVVSAQATIMVWYPGSDEWVELSGLQAALGTKAAISADGTTIISNEEIIPDDGFPYNPAIWRKDEGWNVISNMVLDKSYKLGTSKDLSWLVGIGEMFGNIADIPWVWDAEGGQRILSETDEIRGARPHAVSNDGSVVIGFSGRAVDGLPFPIEIATRWVNEGEPELLTDSQGYELGGVGVCNADCRIITGVAQFPYFEEHPNFWTREAWFWRDDGRAAYLGSLEDAALWGLNSPYAPNDMTHDGSMIVGNYAIEPKPETLGSRGFIWTQNTGLVSIRDLLHDSGLGDDDWTSMAAVSISSTGDKILLAGTDDSEDLHRRAVILELKPKGVLK